MAHDMDALIEPRVAGTMALLTSDRERGLKSLDVHRIRMFAEVVKGFGAVLDAVARRTLLPGDLCATSGLDGRSRDFQYPRIASMTPDDPFH